MKEEGKKYYQPRYIKAQVTSLLKAAIKTEQETINPFDVRGKLIKIDSIVVDTHSDPPYLNIPGECSAEYIKRWNLDVGKFFIRDLKAGNYEKYYEVTADVIKAIVRQLTQEELESGDYDVFQTIQIGDFTYIIVKAINIDGDYFNNDFNTDVIYEQSDEDEDDIEDDVDVTYGYGNDVRFESIEDDEVDDGGYDRFDDNNQD